MINFLSKQKPDFLGQGECPECWEKEFGRGPDNGVVYNVKCISCGTYLLVMPATEKVEVINPVSKW